MAISQTQIVDYLNKKVGYGVTKTDTSTAKYPFNESIASPLLTPGQYIWQQDFDIPNVSSAPSANTVINGSTIVSVYNVSTGAAVQLAPLSESISNETWSTGITNWIPPSFGSGYQLKLYAGPSGASANAVAAYTQLPVAGSGNNDSWFFDYQSGIVNFADTNVPTAVSGNVVYAMGSVYTGALGITNFANVNIVGNITSTSGNIVLTNGTIYAPNHVASANVTAANVVATTGLYGTGVLSSLTVNGVTQIFNATQASSTTTGALQVAGGISTQANLFVGGNARIYGNLEVDGTLTYLNTTTTQISGTEIVAGVISANSGTASSSTTTGALQVLGGAGITGAIYAGSVQNTPIGSTTASTGAFTTLTSTGTVTASGNIVAAAVTPSTTNTTGALVVPNGGIGATGNLNVGVGGGTNVHQILGNVVIGYGNGVSGALTTLEVNNNNATPMNSTSVVHVWGAVGNSSKITNDTTTATTSQGSMFIARTASGTASAPTGVSSGQTLGAFIARGYGSTGFNIVNPAASAGMVVQAAQSFTDSNQGSQLYLNVIPLNTSTAITGMWIDTTGNVVIPATTTSTTTATGALVVAGGAGIAGNATIGANLVVGSGALIGGDLIPSANVAYSLGNPTNQWKSLWVSGNTINIGGVAISANITNGLSVNNAINATVIGNLAPASATFTSVAAQTETVGGLQAVAIGNVTPGTGAFTTLTSTSTVTASGNIVAASGTATTSTSTGALVVLGGVGVSGAINSNGIYSTNGTLNNVVIGNVTPNTGAFTGLTASGNAIVSGNIVAASGTPLSVVAQSLTQGALLVPGTGGAAIGGSVNIGGTTQTGVNSTNYLGFFGSTTGSYPVIRAQGGDSTVGLVVGSGGTGSIAFNSGTNTTVGTGTNFAVLSGATSGSSNYLTVSGTASGSNPTLGINGTDTNVGILITPKGTGNVVITSTTTSTSTTTGALVVQGGVATQGNLNVGGIIYGGTTQSTIALTNPLAVLTGNYNNYTQIQIQNTNTGGASVSADFIATAPNGTDSTNYIDMGINGNNYSVSSWTISGANDGYVYIDGGNLTLGTDTIGKTVAIHVGGLFANNIVATFNANNVQPTSSTTGTMVITGGAGFSGNINVGNAAVFNSAQNAGQDFIVKGKNDNTLIWARPNNSYDSVIIGNSATASTAVVGAKLNINTTDSIIIPVGSSAQRPGTGVAGMVRYNTTSNSLEYYNGSTSNWASTSNLFTTIVEQQFNGDGVTTAFTLSQTATTASCIVSINGILQIGGASYAYTVSGTTLTFSQAPLSTDVIDVRLLTTTATVTAISTNSGYTEVLAVDNVGIQYYTDIGNTATLQYVMLPNGGIANFNPNVTISSAGTATTVDSFYANTYSSAEYTVTSTISGPYKEISKILVVSDGTGAYITELGAVNTAGNILVNWTASMSGNIVLLQGNATNASTVVRLNKYYQAI
jgi:hypothetical protein